MKRKSPTQDDSQPGSSKRQHIDPPHTFDLPIYPPPPADSSTTTPTSSLLDDNNNNIESNPITPPSTLAPSVATTTTTTRRARKFPSDLKTIPCTYPSCPKTFNRPARLAAHLRSHTNDRPHKCPYPDCGKDYLEEKHLAQHIKGSHTHEKKYVCEVEGCGKAFVTATRLRRHAAVHEGQERFRCRGYEETGCRESFRKKATLQRHVRVVHLGLSAFVCSVVREDKDGGGTCEAGFDSAGALRRHMEREHGEVKFWCEECGKGNGGEEAEDDEDGDEEYGGGGGNGKRLGFRTLLALQAHMRKEHVNCVFCDVKCGSQAELERHVDMYHSGTTLEDRKTVECTWEGCGKKFTRVSNLNVHIRTAHKGLRFVCGKVDTFETPDIADWNWMEEGCGQSFMSRVKLEEHVRFVHLGRKRPQKLYTVQSALPGEADEMSAALPTRTIPCSIEGCAAKFVRHHDLEKHLQTEHYTVPTDPNDAIDPRLGDEFWIDSALPAVDQQTGFDAEWAEMRRLIDLDALVDAKE